MKKCLVLLLVIFCMFGFGAMAEAKVYGETRAEIFKEIGYDSFRSYSEGSTGEAILFIQTALDELGYYQGELTGVWGDFTKEALEEFQDRKGLRRTGICDRITMYKIVDMYLDQNYEYEEDFYNPDWFESKDKLASIGLRGGAVVKLVDIETDRVMDIKVQSTGNHVDAEPMTAKDMKVFELKHLTVEKSMLLSKEYRLPSCYIRAFDEGRRWVFDGRTLIGRKVSSTLNRRSLFSTINLCWERRKATRAYEPFLLMNA